MQRLADLPPITPDRVLQLKQEATALKLQLRIKQTAALARIAQREGFSSWERLMARAGGNEAVRAAKPVNEHREQRSAERRQRFGSQP